MGKSSRLKLEDVREAFRIVQEAIDLGNDAVAWRRQMLIRMCKLIDAEYGTCFVAPMQFDPKHLKPPVLVYSPMPSQVQRVFAKMMRVGSVGDDPMTPVVAGLADRPVTMLRRQMVKDEVWYQAGSYKRWREPMGIDDLIHSHDPLLQFGVMSVMGFTRKFGAKPFEPREANIVELVREELHDRWISAAAIVSAQKPLTVRQQQLMSHLKGTMSEKQIAQYMGLSPHTTHNYVRELYRRFNVSGRAELVQIWSQKTNAVVLPRIGYGDA